MTQHLTAAQRALLEADLQQRWTALERRLAEHQGGMSRAEHASDVLALDARDAARREGERGIDMALSDLELRELGELGHALARLRGGAAGHYGRCSDCDADIPFERLRAEPQAQRCIDCETALERQRHRGA